MTNASFDDADYVPPEAPDVPAQEERPYRWNRQDVSKRYGEFRQPPSDREAEQGVLGAMLLSPNTVMEVIEELEPDDFYYPAHALIYQAMVDLYAAGTDIDAVIVASRLDRYNNLERVGGAPYLHTLLATVPTAANARYYAEIVA
ncbi:DnaB-like helicase N-terminal domain-containing protein, partial [Corynebacterium striatum]